MGTQDIINIILTNTNKLQVKKHEISSDGASVYIIHNDIDLGFWVDCHIDRYNDIVADWNQYIFYTDNEDDNTRKEIQENNDIFDIFTSIAINYLTDINYIYQDNNGQWFYNITSLIADEIESTLFFTNELNEIIFDILDELDVFTIKEFTNILESKILNDYNGYIQWEIVKNYSNIKTLTPNALENAKNELLKDIDGILSKF